MTARRARTDAGERAGQASNRPAEGPNAAGTAGQAAARPPNGPALAAGFDRLDRLLSLAILIAEGAARTSSAPAAGD